LVILPETAIDGAAVVANRILRDVAGVDLPSSSLTVSIGAAELREPGSQHDLVEQADAALYTAKRAGKNRVELFG
ncbi:MAG: diguanylate cyclase, partial [Thermomicrobiales bacterium]|nr:diguanylate cyclase [Thermomicrobiales bacterium]